MVKEYKTFVNDVTKGDFARVKAYVEMGRSVDPLEEWATNPLNMPRATALFKALEKKHWNIATYLLEHGAKLHDPFGNPHLLKFTWMFTENLKSWSKIGYDA